MEGLIPILVVIWILSSVMSTSKKQKAQQQKRTVENQRKAMQQYPRPSASSAHSAKPVVMQPAAAKPAAAKPVMMMEKAKPAEVYHPAQPVPMAPTVQVTKHTDDIFEGSMAMTSTEGYDPCHEDELHEAVNPCELAPMDEPESVAATSGLGLSWTGSEMVKAMVMQQVLTRPCDRARR